MFAVGSIDLRPFPKLDFNRIPENSTIGAHLTPNGLHRLMCCWITSGKSEHHHFCQWPMAVAIQSNVALQVPEKGRARQLQNGQSIQQPAKQIGH